MKPSVAVLPTLHIKSASLSTCHGTDSHRLASVARTVHLPSAMQPPQVSTPRSDLDLRCFPRRPHTSMRASLAHPHTSMSATRPHPSSTVKPERVVRRNRRAKTTGFLSANAIDIEEASGVPDRELAELEEGDSAHIGNNEYQISGKLGAGSFATVWSAFSDRGKVAIKEIICRSSKELSSALMERDILEKMGANDRTEYSGRSPLLLGSEISQCKDMHRVRLAMTLLPGRQLDGFLSEQFRIAPEEPREAYSQFFHSFHYAHQLLHQLVPTCACFSALGRHRDISPRNILVDVADDLHPHYGLVDFGHAVDVEKWPMELTMNSLAGDGRYWTVSAWYVFEHGLQELAKDPVLFDEYQSHIDLHALGITALQTLMKMAPRLQDADMQCLSEGSEGADEVLICLRSLQLAWEKYWEDSCKYFKAIFGSCQEGATGALKLLQESYKRLGVHEIISSDLEQVCGALRRLRGACESLLDHSNNDVTSLLDALLLMIRTGDNAPSGPAWQDLKSMIVHGRDGAHTWAASEHLDKHLGKEQRNQSPSKSPGTSVTCTPTWSVCLELLTSEEDGDELLGVSAKRSPTRVF